jgi:hypothetical protein
MGTQGGMDDMDGLLLQLARTSQHSSLIDP